MRPIEANDDLPSTPDPLLDRAVAGDSVALEQLLRDNYSLVHAVCRRLTGSDTDALDASQDALMAVVRGIQRFDRRSRFSTWVYRIAVNASIDELRRRSRRPVPVLDPVAEAGAGSDDGGTCEDAVADRVDVDGALMRLPVEFRAPVVLRDLCGLDYQEIAEVLRIPGGTVRSRIARGRAILVGLLDPEGSRQ
jgi:RNA polymerase sigma-70 factor (ECF subfamily)